jgi:Fur family transcriptional regulator, ferric uptake regulator
VSTRDVDYAAERRGAIAPDEGAPAHALPVDDLSSAMALMRRRGLRVSAARRLVLEALLAADGPMSAEQIAEGIGGRVPSSDIGSVYRNLQALEDIGVVRHVHLGHGPGLHALAVTGEREYLTCERCADYHAVQPQELDAVRELIERQFGYRASFIHFPIVGLCPGCAEAVRGRPRSSAAHPWTQTPSAAAGGRLHQGSPSTQVRR